MGQVLICDDDGVRAKEFAEAISEIEALRDLEVRALTGDELLADIGLLEARSLRARNDSRSAVGDDVSQFDGADIALIDYDLERLGQPGQPKETGRRLAYLVRCYSSCASIVSYNEFKTERIFDLTLSANLESYADFSVSSEDVADPALWIADRSGYRPWSWPRLVDEPARMRSLHARIRDQMDSPILDALGLAPTDGIPLLSAEALSFLRQDEDPEGCTFEEFVRYSSSALHPRDKVSDPEARSRISAARISKWLEHSILAAQNVLVDAPHLVSRVPSLLQGSIDDLEAWDKTAELGAHRDQLGIDIGTIERYRVAEGGWISRHAWLWPILIQDRSLPEVADPWTSDTAPFVFCEDTSRFSSPDEARPFDAPLATEFARRYIKRIPGPSYQPSSFLARL